MPYSGCLTCKRKLLSWRPETVFMSYRGGESKRQRGLTCCGACSRTRRSAWNTGAFFWLRGALTVSTTCASSLCERRDLTYSCIDSGPAWGRASGEMMGIAFAGLACAKGTPLCCSAPDSAFPTVATSASKVSVGSADAATQIEAVDNPQQIHSASPVKGAEQVHSPSVWWCPLPVMRCTGFGSGRPTSKAGAQGDRVALLPGHPGHVSASWLP